MTTPANYFLRLNDGRNLGYAEWGDRRGSPVFYFHGFPGSRLEARLADHAAARHHIRLIGLDRPGYGISDSKTGRRMTDWANDIAELADHLAIERFSVLGVSGGGPYAAACAHELSDRLISTGIACGLGPIRPPQLLAGMTPINRFGLLLIERSPALAKHIIPPALLPLRYYPRLVLRIMAHSAHEPDKATIMSLQIRQVLIASFIEALRLGAHGAISDVILYSQDWGFSLSDIHTPVRLWHGEKDRIVPAAMGRYVARHIPDCQATFYAAEGHFSLVLNHFNDFLDLLTD